MPEIKPTNPLLVAKIVRNYVSYNGIPAGELPHLIASVHRSLADLGKPPETPSRKPAVAISRSYAPTFVICLDCGWRGQMLRRHLSVAHGLSRDDYRARWNLKDTNPLTIDTSQPATDTIDYVATDQSGLTATSTRTLIIQPAADGGSSTSTAASTGAATSTSP